MKRFGYENFEGITCVHNARQEVKVCGFSACSRCVSSSNFSIGG